MMAKSQKDQLKELHAKVEALEAIVVEKDSEIKSLTAQINTMPTAKPAKPTAKTYPVTVNKQQYLVVHGLRIGPEVWSAEQIAKNKDLVAKLVADGSSAVIAQYAQ
jgi:hypothetical protein